MNLLYTCVPPIMKTDPPVPILCSEVSLAWNVTTRKRSSKGETAYYYRYGDPSTETADYEVRCKWLGIVRRAVLEFVRVHPFAREVRVLVTAIRLRNTALQIRLDLGRGYKTAFRHYPDAVTTVDALVRVWEAYYRDFVFAYTGKRQDLLAERSRVLLEGM